MNVSFELWDRFSGNLILDFGDRESALDFVRRQIEGLDEASAAREVERFALERLVDGVSEVLARGSQLLELSAALPAAAGPRQDGYEIWDRFERAFIRDFDTEEQALVFLHEMVRALSFDAAATMLDRFQLVEVSKDGNSTDVKFVGKALMPLVARAAAPSS